MLDRQGDQKNGEKIAKILEKVAKTVAKTVAKAKNDNFLSKLNLKAQNIYIKYFYNS
jgi:hypothetical protein